MYLDLHTVMNTHTNESDRERNHFFSSPTAFINFFQSLFCTLILFSTRFLFYNSYKMYIWGKLMPFNHRFVIPDGVRNADIDFPGFLDSFVRFILFIINGVSLTMSNSCWNCF